MDLTLVSLDSPAEARTFEKVMRAGDLFNVPPGHDSLAVGDDPYVSLHTMGSEDYAAGEA